MSKTSIARRSIAIATVDLRRADASKPAWWELPGGGIDPGETAEAACVRELREEAGVATAVAKVLTSSHRPFARVG